MALIRLMQNIINKSKLMVINVQLTLTSAVLAIQFVSQHMRSLA